MAASIFPRTPWNVYYPNMAMHIRGVPFPVMDHHLREACREWHRKTLCWQPLVAPMDLIKDQGLYQLTRGLTTVEPSADWPQGLGGANMELVKIIRMGWMGGEGSQYSGDLINPIELKYLDINSPGWGFMKANRPTNYFIVRVGDIAQSIRFWPIPSETLTAAVWMTPAIANPLVVGTDMSVMDGDHCSETYTRFRNEIAKGAAAELLMMPGRSWSNPNLGLFLRGQFVEAIAEKQQDVNKDGSRVSKRARGGDLGFK